MIHAWVKGMHKVQDQVNLFCSEQTFADLLHAPKATLIFQKKLRNIFLWRDIDACFNAADFAYDTYSKKQQTWESEF